MRTPTFLLRAAAAALLLGASLAGHAQSYSGYQLYSGGTGPVAVALADVNLDGNLDCLVVNSTSQGVAVRLGNGTGGFTGSASVGIGRQAAGIQTGDFNRDGKPDFVVLNTSDNSLAVRLGDGQGNFTGPNIATINQAVTFSIAEVTGDGIPDCVVMSQVGTVQVLRGDGLGKFIDTGLTSSFTAPTPSGYYLLAVADVNQDGAQDLLAAASGAVQLKLGNGLGQFGPETAISIPLTFASEVMAGDVNQDGLQDVLAADYMTQAVYVRLGTGGGSFGPVTSVQLPDYPAPVKLADINGDNYPDLLAAYYGSSTIYYRLGDGTGAFPTGGQLALQLGNGPMAFAVGDVNRDGRPDFVSANSNHNYTVWLNALLPRRMATGFSQAYGYNAGLTQLRWLQGNGMNRVVFIREVRPGRAALVEPVDGVTYAANTQDMTAAAQVSGGTYTLGPGPAGDTLAYLRNGSIGHVYEMAVYEYITDPSLGPVYRRHPSVRYTFTTARFTPKLSGQRTATDVVLNWTVAAQYKATWFQVQKSTDGTTFTDEGQPVAAADSAAATRSYSQSNATRLGVPTFFRIRMAHADGTVLYSNAVQLSAVPLPVELISFSGRLRPDGSAQLSWATAQEKNSAYFQLQRSLDGVRFDSISQVAAAGNSTQRRDYTAADARALSRSTYYRLRQVDLDGTAHLSPIVVLSPGAAARSFTCWPNPVAPGDEFTVRLTGLTDFSRPVELLIRSATTGQLVRQQQLPVAATVVERVRLLGLVPGAYLLEAVAAEGRWHSKLLVR